MVREPLERFKSVPFASDVRSDPLTLHSAAQLRAPSTPCLPSLSKRIVRDVMLLGVRLLRAVLGSGPLHLMLGCSDSGFSAARNRGCCDAAGLSMRNVSQLQLPCITMHHHAVLKTRFPPHFVCVVSILHYLMISTAPCFRTPKERRGEIQSLRCWGRREIQKPLFYGFSVLKSVASRS